MCDGCLGANDSSYARRNSARQVVQHRAERKDPQVGAMIWELWILYIHYQYHINPKVRQCYCLVMAPPQNDPPLRLVRSHTLQGVSRVRRRVNRMPARVSAQFDELTHRCTEICERISRSSTLELVYIKFINDRETRVPRQTLVFRDAKCDHPSDRPFVAYESPEREGSSPIQPDGMESDRWKADSPSSQSTQPKQKRENRRTRQPASQGKHDRRRRRHDGASAEVACRRPSSCHRWSRLLLGFNQTPPRHRRPVQRSVNHDRFPFPLAVDRLGAHIIAGLLVLVAFLVGGGLGFVGLTLLLVQGLPPLAQDFADLTCGRDDKDQHVDRRR